MGNKKMLDLFDTSNIRPDTIRRVQALMARNTMQPHGVSFSYHPRGRKAGHNNVAKGWGTGRAKARVPRVKGSGTSRAAQAAVANFARTGHMFSPISIWRRWGRIVPKKERDIAVRSCLAASSTAALVEARGHILPEGATLPLVITDADFRGVTKRAEAQIVLEKVGLSKELKRCKESKVLKKAFSRKRNRKYRTAKGPLVIHSEKENTTLLRRVYKTLSGVKTASVHSLNLLQLAPGGSMGRLVVWTESALAEARTKYAPTTNNRIFGTKDIHNLLSQESVKSALKKKE